MGSRPLQEDEDPASEVVQALADEAIGLIVATIGGNAGIERSLGSMYRAKGTKPLTDHGMDVSRELSVYLGRAMEIVRSRSQYKLPSRVEVAIWR